MEGDTSQSEEVSRSEPLGLRKRPWPVSAVPTSNADNKNQHLLSIFGVPGPVLGSTLSVGYLL